MASFDDWEGVLRVYHQAYSGQMMRADLQGIAQKSMLESDNWD